MPGRSRSLIWCGLLVTVVGLGWSAGARQYTFEEVAAGLKSKDADTRLRAIEILRDADYAEAAGPIADLLGDGDDRVQLAAVEAERSLFLNAAALRRRRVGLVIEVRDSDGGTPAEGRLSLKPRNVPIQVLSGLAVGLRDDNPRVRGEVLDLTAVLAPEICAVDPGAASPDVCTDVGNAVINNVNTRDDEVRRAAMRALGLLRFQGAFQALSEQFGYYQQGPNAMAALEGLAGIGHPTGASLFTPLLSSENVDMRRLAVEGVARTGDRSALPEVLRIGQGEKTGAVLLAVHYASLKLGSPGASPAAIVAALGVPVHRPIALGYLLDLAPSFGPAMVSALKDPNPDVRRVLAGILGFARTPAVIPSLEAASKDPDAEVAAAAQLAIERIKVRGTAAGG